LCANIDSFEVIFIFKEVWVQDNRLVKQYCKPPSPS